MSKRSPEETLAEIRDLMEQLVKRELYPLDPLLTLDQAAKLMGLSRRAMYEMVYRREIPVIKKDKFIRIARADLLQWLDSHKVKPL